MTKPNWLAIAEKEIGTHEIAGEQDNPRIVEYASCTSLHACDDETPWCSAFVNWVMKQAGYKGTNLANARSWLDWGAPLAKPVPGCVVILRRGAPPSGHVGLYVSDVASDFIKVLGGNQGDQVKYSNVPKEDVIGYRWPAGVA